MKKINIKREIKEFAADETGMGVVEIVLIIIEKYFISYSL